jgi:hypothetical protein
VYTADEICTLDSALSYVQDLMLQSGNGGILTVCCVDPRYVFSNSMQSDLHFAIRTCSPTVALDFQVLAMSPSNPHVKPDQLGTKTRISTYLLVLSSIFKGRT